MGCKSSKDSAHTSDALPFLQAQGPQQENEKHHHQRRKGRAELQLDLQPKGDDETTNNHDHNTRSICATKPVRTPEVSPRTVVSSVASSEDLRPPMLLTVNRSCAEDSSTSSASIRKRLQSRAAWADGDICSPGTARGSTAELTDSDREETEQGQVEDNEEIDNYCGGQIDGVGTLLVRRRAEGDDKARASPRASSSIVGTAHSFALQNNKQKRRRTFDRKPRRQDTLPPCPPQLQEFLMKHRPASSAATLVFAVASTTPPKRENGGSDGRQRNICRVEFADRMIYEGSLSVDDGMPSGWGTLVLPNNVVYEGNWRDGRIHGHGALRLPNGNVYWGSWVEGRKHGSGTFVWADGSRYDGSYRAGKRSGFGVLHHSTGATFTGQFECDLRHGSGCLALPDGSSYDGEWAADAPHGYGVYVEAGAGGERFEGSWNRGVRSGAGTLVQGYELIEEGNAVGVDGEDEIKSGQTFGDTAWYSGNFEAGLPHGDGVMGYGPATFCGHMEHGVWTGGGGRVDLGDGSGTFEGTWSDGLPQGRGRWCKKDSPGETGADCSFKEGYAKLIWPG